MRVEFLALAKLEFDETIAYYENESEGLGLRFKNEIRSSVDLIVQFPKLYPIFIDDIRKCVTHNFPYTIFYKLEKDVITIYAIANHYRNPLYYAERLF